MTTPADTYAAQTDWLAGQLHAPGRCRDCGGDENTGHGTRCPANPAVWCVLAEPEVAA